MCVCVSGPLKITALNVNCCATRPSLADITSNMAFAELIVVFDHGVLGESHQISSDKLRLARYSRDQLIVCWFLQNVNLW